MSGDRYSRHESGDSSYSHRSLGDGARALALASALTLGYAVVQAAGGVWTGSLALLADAVHMATDGAALLFALAASIVARRPVSDRHSFGLARAEVIAAFVNSLAMLALVGWIFYEAIDRLRQPVPVQGLGVVLIASVGLAINALVAWSLSRHRDNVNTRAALIHVIGDLLGSVAAISAGLIIHFGGPVTADPLLSIFVALLILRSTFAVLRLSTRVLLDGVPDGVDYEQVGQALAQVRGVRSVHDLHVWSMVPGRTALTAHLQIDSVDSWPAILAESRRILRARFAIDHATLQPEWPLPARDAPMAITTSLDARATARPSSAADAAGTR